MKIIISKPTENIKPTQTQPSNTDTSNDYLHEGYKLCAKCSKVWFKGDYTYCNNCKCSASYCDNIKSGNSDRYCSEHMCGSQGCLGIRENGSLFCQSHNCDAGNCKEACADGSRYCLQHKCGQCSSKKEEGSNFCSLHNCSWGGCKAEKYKNSAYCLEHKCSDPNCSNSKQSSSSYTVNYCSNHDCKDCMRDRVEGSFYCTEHKCSVSGCINSGSNIIDGIRYCGNHKPK